MAVPFPPELPLPLREGYTVESPDLVTRTAFEVGPRRLRRRASAGPERVPVVWVLTSAQLEYLMAWWHYDALDGAALVELPLRSHGRGVKTHLVNFTGPPLEELAGVNHWRVRAEVEIRVTQRLSQADYEFIAANGGAAFFGTTVDLYRLVNRTRPVLS